ncbi:hypothetical protein PHYSODRAFT_334153 [Phytophthora sojae]|uniref:SET domain-containing protein n=1 Tax=Phytophthora sojae (strain P6497) TaxID=1094619 RepID=G4ZLB5_PHYSP|nr:hypothetical protein PHYSODRAFT_334153 [Phytophthora sojae]EGZ15961.1 hypothetical protein PHYSODRAFT_334153 [Phytophthora sojae]|eukprot:XP_009529710.1 hypothetical protein PHYSODRAFT_334153 [Phytophthora sojae]
MGAAGEVPAPLQGSDESTAKPGGNTPACVAAADNPSKRQPHDVVANFAGDATNVAGLCGNALGELNKIYLGKNLRTKALGVVAAGAIEAGEVFGQYLGEMEHMQPEKPTHPVRVAINAENMGGLMRFVYHSCEPLTKFVEVSNGRRTTVVMASTEDIRQGQEMTVDYGDDLWFICRCGSDRCRHRHLQDAQDPAVLKLVRLTPIFAPIDEKAHRSEPAQEFAPNDEMMGPLKISRALTTFCAAQA